MIFETDNQTWNPPHKHDTYKCSWTKELNRCGIVDVCVMPDKGTALTISVPTSSNNRESAISTGYETNLKPVSDAIRNLRHGNGNEWGFLLKVCKICSAQNIDLVTEGKWLWTFLWLTRRQNHRLVLSPQKKNSQHKLNSRVQNVTELPYNTRIIQTFSHKRPWIYPNL